jgi:hypothetical protein
MPFLVGGERSLERHPDRRGQSLLVRRVWVDHSVDRKAGLRTITPYSYLVTIFRKPILRRLEKLIPYMDLNEQVDADFTRARRRARLRALGARLRREHTSNRLLSFANVRRELAANNRLYRETRVVEVEEIIGSVGRWRDFDRSFLPARASVGQRWKRIDRAFQRGEDMPPVELYEIGDAYFVVDGHHRVSVARYHDVPTVEAAVAEFRPKLPTAPVPTISNCEVRIAS